MTFSERLRNLWHLLLVPTVRHMTGRRRRGFSVLLCAVLFLSALVLSLFCFSLGAAFARADGLAEELSAHFSAAGGGAAADAAYAALLRQVTVGRVRAVSVMLLSCAVWFLLTVAALSRVFRAAVESEAYVYGLRILFGSDRRQLSRAVRCEFLLSGGCALLPAVPLAGLIMTGLTGAAVPRWPVWVVLLVFICLCAVSARVLVRRLYKSPCVVLIEQETTPGAVSSPRRSRLPGRHPGSLHYARLSLTRRMRYAVSFVLSACLLSSACLCVFLLGGTDGDAADGALREYTVTFRDGTSPDIVKNAFGSRLAEVSEYVSLDYSGVKPAEQYGTFLLLDDAQVLDKSAAVPVGDMWLLDDVRIICGDGRNNTELGGQIPVRTVTEMGGVYATYSFDPVAEGTALYIHSKHCEPRMAPEGVVRIPLPASAGTSPADREYLTVTVTSGYEVPWMHSQDSAYIEVCPLITEDYLILSPPDYARVTGSASIQSISVTECDPDDLSLEANECLLVVPTQTDAYAMFCKTVTAVVPEVPLCDPFRSISHRDELKRTLDDPYYNINRTGPCTFFYTGTGEEFEADTTAKELYRRFWTKYLGSEPYRKVSYRVKDVIVSREVTEPRVVLPVDDRMTWSLHWGETTAFALAPADRKTESRLYRVRREDNVLFCPDKNLTVGPEAQIYIASAPDPEFIRRMDAAHVDMSAMVLTSTVYSLNGRLRTEAGTVLFSLPEREGITSWYEVFDERLGQFHPYEGDRAFYPVHPVGDRGLLMQEGTDADSVVSLADCGAGLLLFDYQIGDNTENAQPAGSLSALNGFTVCPAPESGNLTKDGAPLTLVDGHCAVAGDWSGFAAAEVGDTLQLAVARDLGIDEDSPEYAALTGKKLLEAQAVPGAFTAVTVQVDAVLPGDGAPVLILTENDVCRVIGTDALYTQLTVWVDLAVSAGELADVRAALVSAVARTGGILTEHERVIPCLAARPDVTASVLRAALPVLALLLPLLLTASHAAFCGGRREELDVFRCVGRTGGFVRRMLLWEALLLAAACGLGSFCLGGVCLWVLAGLTAALGIPASAGTGMLLPLCLCAAWSMLSACIAGAACCLAFGRDRQKSVVGHNKKSHASGAGAGKEAVS